MDALQVFLIAGFLAHYQRHRIRKREGTWTRRRVFLSACLEEAYYCCVFRLKYRACASDWKHTMCKSWAHHYPIKLLWGQVYGF
jgi:hypothetical protein